ncbi:competence type IV pilus minor pilin ComGD [Virgibacillus siamensis]|uniref:competence type IV pilus minor pilin ComGD n=1 Tax=Virgibacillus siamensis TaxID=480071 RepID=UPI0009857AEA|nr:competence type IV pilus minor pilin ComGD [Virgibacillus siamensis]
MSGKNGFTLLEVLFVLAILSVLLLLSGPIHVSTLEKQAEKQFLNTLEMDIFYLQNLSYGSRGAYRIEFADSKGYTIKDVKNVIVRREVPEGWQIDHTTFPIISFNHDGLINQPGSLFIHAKRNTYKLICPFGKGRCYVAKQ